MNPIKSDEIPGNPLEVRYKREMTERNKNKDTSIRTGLEIAVIGMAGRFPGARNIAEFWENLKNGKESLSFISQQEIEEAGFDAQSVCDHGYVMSKGGVLEDLEYFDANFFEYSPAEAMLMDPQARLFHECAWEALEDAGYDPLSYEYYIGLYAGSAPGWSWASRAFVSEIAHELGEWQTLHLVDKDFLPTRVSHKLGLNGPVTGVQTACSTSLAAVHTACRALLTGDCRMALAGGVSIIPPGTGYHFQEGMIFSPDGHCRAFDARCGGMVSGNGIGIVVLKSLRFAEADGDLVYAVIKGSAMNNDGVRRAGYTAPGVDGQTEVIRAALRFARVEPETIGYIETHGTGTPLGDTIEIQALKKAFGTHREKFCALGAVKTNVGHLGPAAGMAGLIKTIMALKYQFIPPTLHWESPNPGIDFQNSPFYVNTRPGEWKNHSSPLRAGVSSFGIGGTNVHVILEQTPGSSETAGQSGRPAIPPLHEENKTAQLILLSAKTSSALDRMSRNLLDYFKDTHDQTVHTSLADVAYTLQTGRRAFAHRQIMVCTHCQQAIHILTEPGARRLHRSQVKEGNIPVIFMFSGIGAQYVNMGRELYREIPPFRETMNRCFEILKPLTGYDIKEILYPSTETPDLAADKNKTIQRLDIAHTVVFAFEYALAQLLILWGIKPHALVGYSFGEYTAACTAGVFSLEHALKLAVARGELIQKQPVGSMLSVPLTRGELEPLLEQFQPSLSIAIDNGPACLAAGPVEILEAFAREMKKRRYICVQVPSSRALHTKMMTPICKDLENHLEEITRHKPQIPYISNVTGTWIKPGDAVSPGYWSRHLREMVRFADGIHQLMKINHALLVEIGPGQDLAVLVRRLMENSPGQRVFNLIPPATKNQPGVDYLLNKLGYLWLCGVNIDWHQLHHGEKRHRVSLPTYPFERKRFWLERSLLSAPRPANETLTTATTPAGTKEKAKIETSRPPGNTGIITLFHERPALGSEYTPPTGKKQHSLVNIWQKFFRIQSIGIDDDFFELGGDSLKASLLIAKIQTQLQIDIPIHEFFNRPTIKELASYISEQQKANPSRSREQDQGDQPGQSQQEPGDMESELKQYVENPVVLIIHRSSLPEKLFAFPSGVGYGIVYKHLATQLKNYSFYGFTFIEAENRIKQYADIIMRLQPTGPYRFIGYSVGGRLAFEVAGELEKRGMEAADIILLDSFWPHETGYQAAESPLARMIGDYLQAQGLETLKATVTGKMKSYKNYWSDCMSCQLQIINARVHLILAGSGKNTARTDSWNKFTTRGTKIYQGFGQHGDMLTAGFVEKNAKIIREILKIEG